MHRIIFRMDKELDGIPREIFSLHHGRFVGPQIDLEVEFPRPVPQICGKQLPAIRRHGSQGLVVITDAAQPQSSLHSLRLHNHHLRRTPIRQPEPILAGHLPQQVLGYDGNKIRSFPQGDLLGEDPRFFGQFDELTPAADGEFRNKTRAHRLAGDRFFAVARPKDSRIVKQGNGRRRWTT